MNDKIQRGFLNNDSFSQNTTANYSNALLPLYCFIEVNTSGINIALSSRPKQMLCWIDTIAWA